MIATIRFGAAALVSLACVCLSRAAPPTDALDVLDQRCAPRVAGLEQFRRPGSATRGASVFRRVFLVKTRNAFNIINAKRKSTCPT